jgi:hypothetical protein
MGTIKYEDCIRACIECAAACDRCASACLQENGIDMMRKCIQLDMECAAICYAAARIMSLNSDHAVEICSICASICDECGKECRKHDHDHCQECARLCLACAEECKKMAA